MYVSCVLDCFCLECECLYVRRMSEAYGIPFSDSATLDGFFLCICVFGERSAETLTTIVRLCLRLRRLNPRTHSHNTGTHKHTPQAMPAPCLFALVQLATRDRMIIPINRHIHRRTTHTHTHGLGERTVMSWCWRSRSVGVVDTLASICGALCTFAP